MHIYIIYFIAVIVCFIIFIFYYLFFKNNKLITFQKKVMNENDLLYEIEK